MELGFLQPLHSWHGDFLQIDVAHEAILLERDYIGWFQARRGPRGGTILAEDGFILIEKSIQP